MNPGDTNFRKFGPGPHGLVLVHGGPGTAGYLAPVAMQLSKSTGVIDAWQTRDNIDELLQELHSIIREHADVPVIMLGHSWGAWLSLLFAGLHPALVKKLILVASAPFEDRYVSRIMETRMNRLNPGERNRLSELVNKLEIPENGNKDSIFMEIAGLLKKSDAYDPAEDHFENVHMDYSKYRSVWQEAEQIRASGELLHRIGQVCCPILAIHGEQDPHPAEGVRLPLEKISMDHGFILLEKCGHEPWNEKHASERFYELLRKEIQS